MKARRASIILTAWFCLCLTASAADGEGVTGAPAHDTRNALTVCGEIGERRIPLSTKSSTVPLVPVIRKRGSENEGGSSQWDCLACRISKISECAAEVCPNAGPGCSDAILRCARQKCEATGECRSRAAPDGVLTF